MIIINFVKYLVIYMVLICICCTDILYARCETVTIYRNDQLIGKSMNSYDTNGNIIEQVSYQNGEISSRTTFEYNSNGALVSEIRYTKEGKLWETKLHNYDSNKNEITYVKYTGEKKKLQDSTVFVYENNKKVSEISLKTNLFNKKTESKKLTFEYDNAGRIIKQSNYKNDKMLYFDEYKYDANGVKIETKNYSILQSTGIVFDPNITKHEYDNKGRISKEESFTNDGKLGYQVFYKYNSKGWLLNETHVSFPGGQRTVTEKIKEYDDQGNITLRMEKIDGYVSVEPMTYKYEICE